MCGSIFALKGNLIWNKNPEELEYYENGYLVYEGNEVIGAFRELPIEHEGVAVTDYGDRIIIPGITDLHIHAPQYAFRGLGMDMELLEWLETNTFPEEAKFQDIDYAHKAYGIFVDYLRNSVTTRACIYGTVHRQATIALMDMLEESGLVTMVGKVNMDRNCPDYLREESAEESARETIEWIRDVNHKKYRNTIPILTPRFIPSCTDELLEQLKMVQVRYQLPLQSHLSENPGEIEWVQNLCPESEFYGDAYDSFGMFGVDCPTIMAHCVHSSEDEIDRMKENGVFVAHCPESNMNLSSGIAPIKKFLQKGLHVGLGTDVAAGSNESMFRAMAFAIQTSKIRWRLQDKEYAPLTTEEAFFLATKGGGEFFGKVGSFEAGYKMDAVVLDDSHLRHPQPLSIKQRLERMIYLADDREIYAKYVEGKRII